MVPDPPQTLVDWIATVVDAQPDRPALVADGVVWTYESLWQRAAGIARNLLRKDEFPPGACVAIAGANEPMYLAAYLGIMRAGGTAVPLNPMLDVPAMAAQLELVDAFAVLHGELDENTRDGLAELLPTWPLGDLALPDGARLPHLSPNTAACILLTSGSTGEPKGVVHSQGTMLHAALQLGSTLPFRSDDLGVAFLPFHASIPEQVLPTLCTGGALEVIPRFDVDRVADACRRATWFDAVPTIMARLIDQAPADALSRLRWVLFASEPMPTELLKRWWSTLPTVETHQFYGMTELLPISAAPDWMLRDDPDTVGVPFPTSRLCTVDGAEGEIICRSPARMLQYHRAPQATADIVTEDGAIRTGDLGRIDERGRVFLTGRLKDLIITGGFNVAPAEIEAATCRHPRVAAAAAVGIPDTRWGETPIILVVPTAGDRLTADEVLQHCQRELAGFKRPSGAAVLDSLPATGIGKTDKTALRTCILKGDVPVVRTT